jgi:hypothetical protein
MAMSITITPPPITKPLDMEGKRIYNLGAPVADNDAARKVDIAMTEYAVLSNPWALGVTVVGSPSITIDAGVHKFVTSANGDKIISTRLAPVNVAVTMKLWLSVANSNTSTYWGFVNSDASRYALFWQEVSGNMYAITGSSTGGSSVNLGVIGPTIEKTYRIERYSTTSVKFYIDGVLKATITTNVPTESINIGLFFGSPVAASNTVFMKHLITSTVS